MLFSMLKTIEIGQKFKSNNLSRVKCYFYSTIKQSALCVVQCLRQQTAKPQDSNCHLRSRHPIPSIAEQKKKSKPVKIVNKQDSEMPLNDDYFKDAIYDLTERTTSHLPTPASIESSYILLPNSIQPTINLTFESQTPYDVRHPR